MGSTSRHGSPYSGGGTQAVAQLWGLTRLGGIIGGRLVAVGARVDPRRLIRGCVLGEA